MIAIQATHPTFPLDIRYSVEPIPYPGKRPAGFTESHKCYRYTLAHGSVQKQFDYWTAGEPDILDLLSCLLLDYNTVTDVFLDAYDRPLDEADIDPMVIHLVEQFGTPLRDAFNTARALFQNIKRLRWLLIEGHIPRISDWLESEGY